MCIRDRQSVAELVADKPTLIILDSVESLPTRALADLLDVAHAWSESGQSRVLVATRLPDLHHPAFQVGNGLAHRRIVVGGLGSRDAPHDALVWYDRLRQT